MSENRAVMFLGVDQVSFDPVEMPTPQGDELLIRTEASVISTGTEMITLAGKSSMSVFPRQIGYSNVGRVVDTGPDAGKEWIGKRVASRGRHTAFVSIPCGQVNVVPDAVPLEQATLFALAEIAMGGVRIAEIELGHCVVVYGQGLVGQLATRLAYLNGGRPVLAVDVADSRLDKLPDWPGLVRVNSGTTSVEEVINEQTHQRGADRVIEATGLPQVIPTEFVGLRKKARFVLLGSPHAPAEFSFNACHSHGYEIVGAHESLHPETETPHNTWTRARDIDLFFELAAAGQMALEPLITHRAKPEQASETFAMLREDRTQAMGVVFEWE